MKKYIFGLVAAVALCASVNTAKAEVEVSGGFDLVSASIWRGASCGGPSIQPSAAISAAGFTVTAWASQGLYTDGAGELDFTLDYTIGGLTVAYTNYWWTGEDILIDGVVENSYSYFQKGSHFSEITVAYTISESFPLSIAWNTMIAGDLDYNSDGDRAYSTYIEASYPFSIASVDCAATVGITPWEGYYADEFGVASVGLNFSKNIVETDKFELPLFVDLSFSPVNKDAYLVAGLSFGF